MKGRIIGREGRNIRALEQATGVDLIIDDTPEAVVLSGFDPVRREVARMALTKLISDGRIHPGRIEETVAKCRAEIEVVMRQAGEQAAYDAGVPGLHPELIKLLGRLKYRTSYGQNVLNHCVETARLSGPAGGRDRRQRRPSRRRAACSTTSARRSTTRSRARMPPSAATSPRATASTPTVCNAIAAHHQEVEQESTEATVVQIADAISASRPGARGESLDNYVKRLDDLQQIALSFPGVERCFAIQAGREIRILVRPGGHRRPGLQPPGARRGQEDRGAAPVPRPDQGHRHPRDARGRLRAVTARRQLRIVRHRRHHRQARPAGGHARAARPARASWTLDLVIANGENTAAGAGLTPSLAEELLGGGDRRHHQRQPHLGQARDLRLPRHRSAGAAADQLSRRGPRPRLAGPPHRCRRARWRSSTPWAASS